MTNPRPMTDAPNDRVSVLFVCLGNICRSPLAEALFRKAATDEGVEGRFHIDSAGTSGYHDGDPPDARTSDVARRRGVDVAGTSRRITAGDVDRFDYLVVMDESNLENVERLVARRGDADAPVVVRLREFDPEADGDLDVPDPYFGGPRGFEDVHEIVERSTRALLDHIRTELDF